MTKHPQILPRIAFVRAAVQSVRCQLRASCAALALIASTLLPHAAGSQVAVPPPSTSACNGWVADLNAGGTRAKTALSDGQLESCPGSGPQAVAAALDRAHASKDTAYLGPLYRVAGALQHPSVFSAALRLAGDAGAATAARASGLVILAGQLGLTSEVRHFTNTTVTGSRVLVTALPSTGGCAPLAAGEGSTELATVALPDSAPRRAAAVIDPLIVDGGAPTLLRNLARCVRPVIDHDIPPQIDVSGVTFEYFCDGNYGIYNPTGRAIPVDWEFDNDPDSPHGTVVLASSWFNFSVSRTPAPRGRLLYDGKAIQTVDPAAASCAGSPNGARLVAPTQRVRKSAPSTTARPSSRRP